jgi:phospholipid/cholesterol/gamma-HCH transport system permease protein
MSVTKPLLSTPPQNNADAAAMSPHIERRETPSGVTQQLRGQWAAADLAVPAVWAALVHHLGELEARRETSLVRWDLRQIVRFDHVGAQVLWTHWGRQWPADVQADDSQRRILDSVARFSLPPPARTELSWRARVDSFGAWLLRGTDHALGLTRLLGQLLLDLLRLMRRPQDGPWRDVSGHLFRIGATALPITALVGFLIGVVLAYLISRQLLQFGADAFVVNILGVSLIRELGPMLAAILIAGRSGSSITAQIGVMRVTEELDAMRVLGIARGFRLVLPRALALALVMPLISIWTTAWSLLGGMLTADLSMNVSLVYFANALPGAVEASNLVLATAKSAVFGLLIALIAGHYGLRVKPNTESLGQGTTASVVTSITVVILVDALFAVLFRNVGI